MSYDATGAAGKAIGDVEVQARFQLCEASIVDLLDSAAGRNLAGCGHHGQHPRRAHVAQQGAEGEREDAAQKHAE